MLSILFPIYLSEKADKKEVWNIKTQACGRTVTASNIILKYIVLPLVRNAFKVEIIMQILPL